VNFEPKIADGAQVCHLIKATLPAPTEDAEGGWAVEILAALPIACPADNNKEYTANDGTKYTVECSTEYENADIPGKAGKKDSLELCIEYCQSLDGCVAVSWDRLPKQCKPKSSLGTKNTNKPNSWSARQTSYVPPNKLTCDNNEDDGTTYTNPATGEEYIIECNVEYSGNDMFMKARNKDSFEECVAYCDATTGCIDVTYQGKTCTPKDLLGSRQTNKSGKWTARKLNGGYTCPADGNTPGFGVRALGEAKEGPNNNAAESFDIYCASEIKAAQGQVGTPSNKYPAYNSYVGGKTIDTCAQLCLDKKTKPTSPPGAKGCVTWTLFSNGDCALSDGTGPTLAYKGKAVTGTIKRLDTGSKAPMEQPQKRSLAGRLMM
jgi:hypothetical protein